MEPQIQLTVETLKNEPFMKRLQVDFDKLPGDISLEFLAQSFEDHLKREHNRLPFRCICIIQNLACITSLAGSVLMIASVARDIYNKSRGVIKSMKEINNAFRFDLFFKILALPLTIIAPIYLYQKNISKKNALQKWNKEHEETLKTVRAWIENSSADYTEAFRLIHQSDLSDDVKQEISQAQEHQVDSYSKMRKLAETHLSGYLAIQNL